MKSSKTTKLWCLTGLALLGTILAAIFYKETIPMMANQEKSIQTTTSTINKVNTTSSPEAYSLESQQAGSSSPVFLDGLQTVENSEGLKATAKALILAKDAAFPNLNTSSGRYQLLSGVVLPSASHPATYKYVDETGSLVIPSSAEIGFQKIYVEITESYKNSSIRVPIPVTITNNQTTLLQNNKIALQQTGDVLYTEETKEKTAEELRQLVKDKIVLKAWSTETGKEASVTVSNTTIVSNTIGIYKATFKVNLDGTEVETDKNVTVFGATLKSPKYFTAEQGSTLALGANAGNFLGSYQTSANSYGASATYQWVANKEGDPTEPVNTFDSSSSGFHWGYIKMTDNADPTISTVIPVPISVLNERTKTVGTQVGMSYEPTMLNTSEIEGKTIAEIVEILSEKLSLTAWDLASGETLPIRIIDSSIAHSTRGVGEIKVEINWGAEILTASVTIPVFPDSVFPEDDFAAWEVVPENARDGYITNPINNSKLGFLKRGLSDDLIGYGDYGFRIVDSTNQGYVYRNNRSGQGRVTDIPGVDGTALYRVDKDPDIWSRSYGVEFAGSYPNRNISSAYFLRKGNLLKEILVDANNQILYVYNLSLSRNLNFSVKLDMYNLSMSTRSFSMLESVDTDYYDDKVPIYALGNNSGFYMQPKNGMRFAIKLKDAQGDWLSAYQKYYVGSYQFDTQVSESKNYFGNDFSKAGREDHKYEAGETIVTGTDSAYQLGAPWQDVAPDEALQTGYEVFAGEEIPYMELQANPEEFHVYEDYTSDFKTNYSLSKIPSAGNQGTIYVTYPNDEEAKIPFVADHLGRSSGEVTIPRASLSDPLNEEPGTIKQYTVSLLAIDETEGPMQGLPSNECSVQINVYNLGAAPIAQTIQKDSIWNKTAASLIQDPVILPGHTASYEYVNAEQPVDTSIVGLQYAEVRMTDTDEPSRSTIIRVPVLVVEGTPPTSGLIVAANDFFTSAAEVAGLSEAEIHALILKKSEAIAWDADTGLSADIELSVTTTTLTNQAEDNQVYTATIQAQKGSVTKSTEIEIRTTAPGKLEFSDSSSLMIDFKLHDPKHSSTIRVNDPDVSGKLEISDTRLEPSSGWTLKVQLTAALSNGSIILPEAIRYKRTGSEEFIVNSGKQIIANDDSGIAGTHNISEQWGSTKDSEGFKFEVQSVKVAELGEYNANLLFTLEETYQP